MQHGMSDKPLNIDEDNIASQFKDYEGWTIHRKRAWTALFCGAHYDYIDFSIVNYCPTGTPESQKYLHTWYKNICDFITSIDFVKGKPIIDVVTDCPVEVLESVFGIPGKQYNIYLADKRELNEPGYGETISGKLKIDIVPGRYDIIYYSPEIGTFAANDTVDNGIINYYLNSIMIL